MKGKIHNYVFRCSQVAMSGMDWRGVVASSLAILDSLRMFFQQKGTSYTSASPRHTSLSVLDK